MIDKRELAEKVVRAYEGLFSFKKTEVSEILKKLNASVVAIFAGNRGGKCVTYQTLIDTPYGEFPVGELFQSGKPFIVYAWDGKNKVVAKAHPPFKKDAIHKCYRITMSDGRWIEAADHHRILLSDGGYSSIEDLLCTYYQTLPLSNSDIYRQVHAGDASRYAETQSSYPGRYLGGCHPCGGLLPVDQDNGQAPAPLQDDAWKRIAASSRVDGSEYKYKDNPLSFSYHLSNQGVLLRVLARIFGFLDDAFCRSVQWLSYAHQASLQPCFAGFPCLQSTHGFPIHAPSVSYHSPLCIDGNHIIGINSIPCQEVFDFTVSEYHNYFAGGLVHHNTSSVAEHYVERVLGFNRFPVKNKLAKKIRCMSSSLPESSDVSMQDNAQYIELRKYVPYEQIEKDITARSQNLVVRRPLGLSSPRTVFEFRSSKQELQDLGKINLSSVWHDEETPEDRRTECQMRLIQEGGDEIFTLTATNPFSYTYDKVFRRSAYIFRTKSVSEYTGLPQEERHQTGASIASLFMSTWDNPTLPPEEIKRMMSEMDPAEIPLRIYGVFTQVTGRVHKTYNPSICFIPFKKYFPDGIPLNWIHARGIDFHESRIPWSVGWVSVSKDDEAFLWKEFHPAIDGPNAYNTYDIAKHIARHSGNYYYTVNLIDPLANKKQPNTLFSTTDDLNRHFDQLRREEGLGTPCYWQGWDTKGTGGRDQVATRFKNAVRCGRPFNNTIRDRGTVRKLPTLWICDTAPKFHRSIMDWSYGEYVAASTRAVNDPKPIPQPKNSHDPLTLECIFKDHRMLYAAHLMQNPPVANVRKAYSVTGR